MMVARRLAPIVTHASIVADGVSLSPGAEIESIVGRGVIFTPPPLLSRCGHPHELGSQGKQPDRTLQLCAKLSRTIADLAGSEAITQVHLAEALQCRPKPELM